MNPKAPEELESYDVLITVGYRKSESRDRTEMFLFAYLAGRVLKKPYVEKRDEVFGRKFLHQLVLVHRPLFVVDDLHYAVSCELEHPGTDICL